MSALAFLARRQIRNFFLGILRSPSKLILYLFTLGMLAVMLVFSTRPQQTGHYADVRILHGIFLGWLLFLGTVSLLASLKSGTSIFKMSDVNLLFVSPVSPRHILFYGLAKQMVATLAGFIFMLFYSSMLVQNFNITVADVILLIAATVLFIFIIQVLSLLLYSFCNGKPGRQNAVKAAVYLLVGGTLAAALAVFAQNGGTAEAAFTAAASPVLEYFPVAGWMKGVVFALIDDDAVRALAFGLLLAVFFGASLALFQKMDVDYYEDAIYGAETRFEVAAAAKTKQRTIAAVPGRKTKVGRTGIGGGWGADAFFFKHLCEARRRSRFVFVSMSTFVMLAVDLALCFAVRSATAGGGDAPGPDRLLLIALAASAYILFLMNAAGDWSRELGRPTIYLVPEKPLKKLLWASLTSILKPAVDGAVLFTVLCAAVGAHPLTGAACFLCYASLGLFFTAGSVLAERAFGGVGNRGLVAVLFMALLFLLLAPGIGAAAAVAFLTRGMPETVRSLLFLLPDIVWNTLAAAAIFYGCRNLLAGNG